MPTERLVAFEPGPEAHSQGEVERILAEHGVAWNLVVEDRLPVRYSYYGRAYDLLSVHFFMGPLNEVAMWHQFGLRITWWDPPRKWAPTFFYNPQMVIVPSVGFETPKPEPVIKQAPSATVECRCKSLLWGHDAGCPFGK